MIVKVKKDGFIPASKNVRFGYAPEVYCDLFGMKEHILYVYPTKKPHEYLVRLDAVTRDSRVGSVATLNEKMPATQELIKDALEHDYCFEPNEYEFLYY